MPTLDKYQQTQTVNVLLGGFPKGSGKSTLAMYGPGRKIILQYDIGSPTVPPGINPADVFIRSYPPAFFAMGKVDPLTTDKWSRPKNVGADIINDIFNLRDGILEGKPVVLGGEEVPWIMTPGDTVIMDGMVQWSQHILDWVLAVNGKANPEDFENRHAPWGKRLNQQRILWDMVLPLPVNVVVTTWAKAERVTKINSMGKQYELDTGRILPDLGGKMDIWGPGKMDAALYLFSEQSGPQGLRYKARVRPNENFPWIGVRNSYESRDPVVDITIMPGDSKTPWFKIFST